GVFEHASAPTDHRVTLASQVIGKTKPGGHHQRGRLKDRSRYVGTQIGGDQAGVVRDGRRRIVAAHIKTEVMAIFLIHPALVLEARTKFEGQTWGCLPAILGEEGKLALAIVP